MNVKMKKDKTFVPLSLSHFDLSMSLNLGKKQVGRVLGGAKRTLPGNYGHAAMLASSPDQILYKPVCLCACL